MEEDLTGRRRSEVYREFEQLFDDSDLFYTPFESRVRDVSTELKDLDFLRIEGSKKYYAVRTDDEDYMIAVKVEELEQSCGITDIETLEGPGGLSDYLKDYFNVE